MQRPSPSHYPNLPRGQRFTQWLVDAFNADESAWRRLRGRIDRLRSGRREEHGGEESETEETRE
jgi:RecB family exonuclease